MAKKAKQKHTALAVEHLGRDRAIHVVLFGVWRSMVVSIAIHFPLQISAHKEWLHCQGKRRTGKGLVSKVKGRLGLGTWYEIVRCWSWAGGLR